MRSRTESAATCTSADTSYERHKRRRRTQFDITSSCPTAFSQPAPYRLQQGNRSWMTRYFWCASLTRWTDWGKNTSRTASMLDFLAKPQFLTAQQREQTSIWKNQV